MVKKGDQYILVGNWDESLASRRRPAILIIYYGLVVQARGSSVPENLSGLRSWQIVALALVLSISLNGLLCLKAFTRLHTALGVIAGNVEEVLYKGS
jgi:hypothetical protein